MDILLAWGSQIWGLVLSVNSHVASIGSSPGQILGEYYESDRELEERDAECIKKCWGNGRRDGWISLYTYGSLSG